ncbi:MAG: methyltransferase domain-containing protein [Lachnospiraceae bacterium]|nr:methyltransferase domain-containing protein [Lachnospiraceae bacterium]
MKKKIMTITDWVHSVLASSIEEGDFCIDATAGKGKDTLFLAEKAGESGQVLAFDIQEEAIFQAEQLINDHGYREQVRFVLDGHEHMERYADKDSAAVILFNLGYLPGGDHTLATKESTTLEAAKKGLSILKKQGVMCICIYSGGDSGFSEKEAVLSWVQSLPAKEYDVISCSFINKPNHPPLPVFIRKR